MRVAVHVGQLRQPVPGGIGRYVRALVAALPDAGVDVTAFAAGPRPDGVAVAYTDLGWPPAPLRYQAWNRIGRPSLRIEAEVVHAPSLAVPPAGRLPLVVTIHDLAFLRHPEHLTPRGVAFHRRGMERASRHAAAFVVPTAAVATELADAGIEPARVHVAHHGADPVATAVDASASAHAAAAVDALGVQEPFVLFVGTVEPRKGVGNLVEAHTVARRAHDRLGLVVAGPAGWGPRPDVDRPGVVATGAVDDDVLDALYRRAIALVLPSRYEGFGFPVLEAMARGCPVVVSDAAALVEVAGDAGVVVPVGDVEGLAAALVELAGDPTRRAALADVGRRRAATFTWQASAEAHAAAYRAALE